MAIVKISDLPMVDSPVEGTDLFVVVQDNVTKKAFASDIQTYVGFEEVQTATAGQTVFNLTTMTYAAGANNLMVFVDGVNQYEGSSYQETDNNTVTFTQGLHEGALVKFSTVQTQTSLVNNAGAVTFLQAGTGAVPTNVQTKLRETVSVKDFGAVCDGITDDTAAIQAAANYARTNGYVLTGPAGTCLITSTVILLCDCDLSTMTWNANALNVKPVIRVGPTSGGGASTELVVSKHLKLPKVVNTAKTTTGWNANWGSGIELAHVFESRVEVPWIEGFKVGLDCGGYDYGFAYNEVHLGRIYNNEVGLLAKPKGVGGWANENLFINGRFVMDSAEGVVANARYIKLAPFDVTNASTSWPNNNVFQKPSIEEQGPQYAVEIAGAFNWFQNARFEGNNDVLIVGHSASTVTFENQFIGGYQVSSLNIVTSGVVLYTAIWNSRASSIQSNDVNFNLQNVGSDAYPVIQVFPGSVSGLYAKGSGSTDWSYKLTSESMLAKSTGTTPANAPFSLTFSNGAVTTGPLTSGVQRQRVSAGVNLWTGSLGNLPAVYGGNDNSSAYTSLRLDGNPVLINSFSGGAVQIHGDVEARTDDTKNLGTASYRWAEIFCVNPVINTSDEREKQDVRNLTDAEHRVAKKLKQLVRAYRWKNSVKRKGDNARIHVGVIAQDVVKAFESEGLDAMKYGIVCYDEWNAKDQVVDSDGNVISEKTDAGNRYGVRYEELLAFIIAAI
jgi:hypothetical protein